MRDEAPVLALLRRCRPDALADALLAVAGDAVVILDDAGAVVHGGAEASAGLPGRRVPLADGSGYLTILPAPPAPERGPDPRMLDESNHRVRNNLAMICALLEMELLQAPPAARRALRVSLARTRSLALPHNLAHDAAGGVEAALLARAAVDGVRALYAPVEGDIEVRSLAPATVRAPRAVYLALAVTELAAHLCDCALARARPLAARLDVGGADGTVTLALQGGDCRHGCPPDALAPLSRDILTGLVERSLGGTLEIATAPFRVQLSCPGLVDGID